MTKKFEEIRDEKVKKALDEGKILETVDLTIYGVPIENYLEFKRLALRYGGKYAPILKMLLDTQKAVAAKADYSDLFEIVDTLYTRLSELEERIPLGEKEEKVVRTFGGGKIDERVREASGKAKED